MLTVGEMDSDREQSPVNAERSTREGMSAAIAAVPAETTVSLASVGEPPPAPKSLRILLAEDHAANREMMVCVLRGRGHDVSTATNGREAVAAVQQSRFDVVLMDVHMPEMDGYEATAAIRAGEAGGPSHVPIIAMTGDALPKDRAQCLAAGMDDYLPKPAPSKVVVSTIARCLEKLSSVNPRSGPTEGGQK